MIKRFILVLVCFTLVFAVFLPQDIGVAANGTVTIAESTVNVRNGPGLSYQLVKQVAKGEKFTIIKEKDGWIQIQLSTVKTGWVANWVVTKSSDRTSTSRSSNSKKGSAEANTNQLRVRSGPGTSFRIIGYLNKGQAVSVLDENENWLKISASFGEGWVAREYMDLKGNSTNSKENNNNKSIDKGIVTDTLNIRIEPSTKGNVIGKLSKGTTLSIYSKKNNWLEIKYDGQSAWVSSDFVQIGEKSQPSKPNGIIGTVTASSLSVRDDSSLNSKIVGSVSKGQEFAILDEVNNWVKIEYKSGKTGWAAGWYFNKDKAKSSQIAKDSKVTILHNGTNIRKDSTVQSTVLQRANEGDSFHIVSVENDWYEIKLSNGKNGYIAGWVVTTNGTGPSIDKQGAEGYLKYKTIVIDPGHGGIDNGATGSNGTLEKELTLRTAQLLSDKLKAAGANVFLTRSNDSYLPLPSRVRLASIHQADAFLSLHYDSNLDRSVRGMTGYYYHSYQKKLAEYVYNSTNAETRLKSRGVRSGDYHVVRENQRHAVLMELGYLSNSAEEMTLTSGQFQESASTGIYNGLARYFKEQ
ncbi:SH3 domain-containing protein [Bacillus sp. EB106-08-02-XG196]|uniref:SH3 domain-containing protein n=1 Tax=Bacillus sp. EB106-08-02-XG196 TaxID=2737049 RepID=UPI0015C42CC2|nr:SH3 domain-containing protein [Bacillus sp. EB106-08-02-XG196]NWQ40147.1 SH3 domain-containing protein [Bacillus sp. EB106-08-02-XG196]